MKRTIYIVFVILVVLTSCERQITYNGEVTEPKLVIQTEMQAGRKEINCSVSHSAFFLDQPKSHLWIPSKGLILMVERENGETVTMVDTFLHKPNDRFLVRLATPLQAGERVFIQASHPDYPTAFAADTIVPMPEFTISECVWDSVKKVCRVSLRFGDNADFHGILGIKGLFVYKEKRQGNQNYGEYRSKRIVSMDNIFLGLGNSFSSEEGYNTFGELFCMADNARNKEVKVALPPTVHVIGGRVKFQPDSVQITVLAHSTVSYLFKKSLYSYFDATGVDEANVGEFFSDIIGTEEVVQLYSNVENGYGVVAGTTQKMQKIIFKAQE